ncbi:MAG: acetate/propionate family kinase [Chthoniobacterales bacterium]
MATYEANVLIVNAGSSSLKLAFISSGPPAFRRKAQFEKIGFETSSWELELADGSKQTGQAPLKHAVDMLPIIKKWLGDAKLTAIAHRVVHSGPDFSEHTIISPQVLNGLKKIARMAPEHLPREIELIEAFFEMAPGIPQIACFDTVFHTTLLPEAKTFALPKNLRDHGIQRYGFHGLSYEYIASWMKEHGCIAERCIVAHLGNGCSMTAIRDGQSIDTTMGFTPAAGLVMGTRCGDLDPGIFRFLADDLGLSALKIDRLLNHESGLRGLSETSSDMRDLLAAREEDPRAALALDVFCHNAKQHLASLAATLGGVDRIIFTGGIGEHAPEIRAKILSGLEFMGLHVDTEANRKNQTLISSPDSPATIHVVPTNEEAVMFQIATHLISHSVSS